MVSLTEHKRTIRGLKEKWAEERMTQRLQEEELQKEIRELKKFQSMQKEKDQMYALSQELLGTMVPSSSYPVFLFEQFVWFKLRAMKEGRSFEITTSAKFLETFLRNLKIRICYVNYICMRLLVLWTSIQILSRFQEMFS